MATTIPVMLDGITDVPEGHIATIKTYLRHPGPIETMPDDGPGDLRLERLFAEDHARYRRIFATLGHRWLWWSRLMLSAEALAAILGDPAIEACAITSPDGDIGLLELDFREPGGADLAFLGLFEGQTGKGSGHRLVRHALMRAVARGETALTVNTCTFDHPAALGFYRSCGFEPVKQAIELVPDPRLTGLLPRNAAPHVPLARERA